MKKNLIKILEARNNKNFKIEPVYKSGSNYESLISFLKKQKYISNKKIFDIIKKTFISNKPIGNIMLDMKNEPVGFLGTIYSSRVLLNKETLQCCLHTWIVNEKYRLNAYKLLTPVINKNIFIFTFSPISQLVGLYKKLGFENKQLFTKINFILPIINLFRDTKINLDNITTNYYDSLSLDDQKIFNQHNKQGLIFSFFKKKSNSTEYLFIISKKSYKKFLPCLEILYISNKEIYRIDYKIVNNFFLKKYGVLLVIEYILSEKDVSKVNKNLFTKIRKRDVCFLNKPKNYNFDCLYSELII